MISALLASMVAAPAAFKVPTISLKRLVEYSDAIVVARVERISRRDGLRIAFAKVESVVTGKPRTSFEFIAEPTWACDISDARMGERALYFLVSSHTRATNNARRGVPHALARGGVFELAHSGRGRLLLKGESPNGYATWEGDGVHILPNLAMPADLPYERSGRKTSIAEVHLTRRVEEYAQSLRSDRKTTAKPKLVAR